ncbi:N-acetylneuraminate anomerase [Photobacterium toruni]|uniref:N-acetylneuraminate anomerase n=1 Tax=Photobacterium toruni TaxID=1935446 RepID=A0ABU6L1Y2_9GAMM|nr:N-acetylneuraminate anomerase [Photobacterium toruni]
MIFGEIKQPLHALPTAFQQAINFIKTQDLAQLENGRYEIDGDRIFANVMSFETQAATTKQGEVHQQYIDFQYLISGEERIDVSLNLTDCIPATDYDHDNDFALVETMPNTSSLLLKPGMFLAIFPQQPHKPGCVITTPMMIKKVVIKIHQQCLV